MILSVDSKKGGARASFYDYTFFFSTRESH
jgi:hypothetical protein